MVTVLQVGFYQSLFIAVLGGIAGGLLTILARLIGEHYERYLDRKRGQRSQIYIPIYNGMVSIAANPLSTEYSSTKRSWLSINGTQRIYLSNSFCKKIDEFIEKQKQVRRVEARIYREGGIFDTYVPENIVDMRGVKSSSIKRGAAKRDDRGYTMPARKWLLDHIQYREEIDSFDEFRQAIHQLANEKGDAYESTVDYWETHYPGWAEGLYEVLQSKEIAEWYTLRKEFQQDAEDLKPYLEFKICGPFRKILLLPSAMRWRISAWRDLRGKDE